MLKDTEILVLKLSYERRLLSDKSLARCVALYKASQGSRKLGDILIQEGKISTNAATRVGQLSATARQSKGSVIVSRRDMEDELVSKLLLHSQAVTEDVIKKAQLEQKGMEKQGRFVFLGELLVSKNAVSQINYRKLRKQALDRLATCCGCYRHYVTPPNLTQTEYPCRHCNETIYVGEMPDQAYQVMNGLSGSAIGSLVPRAPSTRPPKSPLNSGNIRRPNITKPVTPSEPKKDKDPNRIFMTGRFDQIPELLAKKAKPKPQFNVDEEMTVTLQAIQRGDKDSEAPTGAKFGDFEVLKELARGGYGVVYKARYKDHIVALKVLLPQKNSPEQAIKRFRREAEICKQLKHHGIVSLVASGDVASYPYMAMEYIEGDTIEERISAGPLDPKIAAKIMKEVGESMQFAHRKGIIHRDLKPANVIIDAETQQPKIIDFGVAKSLVEDMKLTQSQATIGTPFYMAPEQVKGQRDKVGPKTDVYALGVILYEMITGQVPFTGDNPMELYHNIASESVELPSNLQARISEDLETICLCAMAKEIDDRYESALELSKDLGRYLSGKPIKGRRPGGTFADKMLYLIIIGAVVIATGIIAVALIASS